MATTFQVPKEYQNLPYSINFEHFETKTDDLDNFIFELKSISTHRKWSTWGRTYIEISPSVLINFGILSTTSLVVYVNYVFNEPYFYCYPGEIFSGDAAWFDSYQNVDNSDLKDLPAYKRLKKALEDKSKKFINHFDNNELKWDILPVENEEIAILANKLNKHL